MRPRFGRLESSKFDSLKIFNKKNLKKITKKGKWEIEDNNLTLVFIKKNSTEKLHYYFKLTSNTLTLKQSFPEDKKEHFFTFRKK